MNDLARVSVRSPRVQVGEWLKNKWHVDELLGTGGVGSVYRVTHRNNSRAAIKVLHPELATDEDLVARFLREGYAANAVRHPAVVQVLDDDRTDDGLVFLVMELLEGETLEAHARRRGGRLSVAEVVPIADTLLSVLEAAHEKGIVHRDLKTDNVFLCVGGAVKVLDFGLARIREGAEPRRSGTQLGAMMGTPGFMPPEQVRGLWNQVDARSDLWAVGATLHALLCGRRVHEIEGEQIDVFAAATRQPDSVARHSPELPAAIVGIVDKALMLDPAQRWQSAAAMRAALRAACAQGAPGSPEHAITLPARAVTAVTSAGWPRSASAPSLPGSGPRDAGSERRADERRADDAVADNLHPIEIAPGTFWVGMRDPRSIFHANPFLRVFRRGSFEPFHLLVDPGSSSDFAVVSSKVSALTGGLNALSGLFINHQDPDVGSSASQICARHAPRAAIYTSEATWRLIVHFNLPRDRFRDTDLLRRGFEVPTGHLCVPVPSPFCHFRGAVMLYDPETRVLFSGDLLGGLSTPGLRDLWAEPGDWSGVRAFHQMYMPTGRALAAAVRAIRRLDPPVEIIAPQHGRLLRGAVMERFLDQLETLPVGLDILDDLGDAPDALAAWSSALNRVLHIARMILGDDVDAELARSAELKERCTKHGERFEVRSGGRWVLGTAVRLLTMNRSATIANPIRLEAVHACEELELPSPDLMLEGEGSGMESGPARR